ncbi:MAG: Flp family type IVb pilin [Bryobacteraceae bacterium]
MRPANTSLTQLQRLWSDENGQDLIEYALLSGFIAVVVAGVLPPAIMPLVSGIFSKVTSSLAAS